MLRHRPYLARKNIQGGPDKNPPQITDSKNIRPDKKPLKAKVFSGFFWGEYLSRSRKITKPNTVHKRRKCFQGVFIGTNNFYAFSKIDLF